MRAVRRFFTAVFLASTVLGAIKGDIGAVLFFGACAGLLAAGEIE